MLRSMQLQQEFSILVKKPEDLPEKAEPQWCVLSTSPCSPLGEFLTRPPVVFEMGPTIHKVRFTSHFENYRRACEKFGFTPTTPKDWVALLGWVPPNERTLVNPWVRLLSSFSHFYGSSNCAGPVTEAGAGNRKGWGGAGNWGPGIRHRSGLSIVRASHSARHALDRGGTRSRIVLIHSMQIILNNWGKRSSYSAQMGNRCLTVVFENGETSKKIFEGITKPQRGAKKASESIPTHTCISEEVQKTTGRHSFCWKRRSQGSRTLQKSSPWSPNKLKAKYSVQTGRTESSYISGATGLILGLLFPIINYLKENSQEWEEEMNRTERINLLDSSKQIKSQFL